jgi:hypothetical protein
MNEPHRLTTENTEVGSDRRPWHKPVMEVMPISQTELFITTRTDASASANS